MKILFLLVSILFACQVQATTFFSENFNDQPDWNSCTEGSNPATALNTSTSGHAWKYTLPPQPYGGGCDGAAVKSSQVSASYKHGASGKGLRFNLYSTSFSITAFADYSGTVAGTVRVTTSGAHYLTSSQNQIIIAGTTNYNGAISVFTVIDGTSFYFTHAWNGNDAAGTVGYNCAQESCWRAEETFAPSAFFWGYWFKISEINLLNEGTNTALKLGRFYSAVDGKSVIPELYYQWDDTGNTPIRVYYNESTPADILYRIPDTGWHSYIWEFQRGTNTNDGVIRLWVDESLEYEKTNVNWNDTGTVFDMTGAHPYLQGNLSGSWDGGAITCDWDDCIWTTTKAEIEAFLGTSGGTAIFGAGTGTCTFGAGTGSTTF